jgi:DNA-binding transcriptional MerR regulator/CheY-like chemotaxis protein
MTMSQAEGSGGALFSISAVARLAGVPAATIRTWESRYGLVIPERSQGGHRIYSQDQAEQLKYLRARVAEGLSAADAHRLLAAKADGLARPVHAHSRVAPSGSAQPGSGQPESAPPGPAPIRAVQATDAGSRADSAGRSVVLLAERDRFAAAAAEHCLVAAGFDVRVAFTAADALSLVPRDAPGGRPASARPVVAVVELLISGGAGLELCRSLHQHGVPVIAASVLNCRDEALAAGASYFLAKPLDSRQLPGLVAACAGGEVALGSGRQAVRS